FGGGVFSGGKVSMSQSTLSGNSCSRYGGGLLASGDVKIEHCTIVGNAAGNAGGGVFANSGSHQIAIDSSILAENKAYLFGANSDIFSLRAPIQLTYSLIGDNAGTSLIEAPVGLPDANGN